MTRNPFASALSRPDIRAVFQIARLRRFSLAVAASTAVLSLAIGAVPGLPRVVHPEWWLSFNVAQAALACTIGLGFSRRARARSSRIWLSLLAIAATIPALQAAAHGLAGSSFRLRMIVAASENGSGASGLTSVSYGFVLLAMLLPLLTIRRQIASYVIDLLVCILALGALSLSTSFFFSAIHVFGGSITEDNAFATLIVFSLLAFVAFTQRAEYGIFHVLFGTGISGRIARTLTPFCIVVPFLREAARAKILNHRALPEASTAASLASLTSIVGLVLLVLVCRKIRAMETEIRTLSLRDELTGLYNLRGFRFLAEQALRLAERSGHPFSVLFVDLDHLKQINDSLGHQAGSDFLVDTAELLMSNFRGADVVGRIGGDEFAVAGEFTDEEIQSAVARLEFQTSAVATQASGRLPLSLSMGYVTAYPDADLSLDDLLAEADAAMYERKRARKQRNALPLAMIHGV